MLAEVIAIVRLLHRQRRRLRPSAEGGGFGADTPFADCGTGLVSCNTEQLGWVLYTSYLIPFELASMLLLVAMIGAIVLAKRHL